jgi:hypothetical protein
MRGREAKVENRPQCVGVKMLELNILFGKKHRQTLCHYYSLFPSVFAVACFIFTFPALEEVSFVLDYVLVCGILGCRLNSITRLYGGLPMRNGFKHFTVPRTLWLDRKKSERGMKQAFRCPQLIQYVL